MNKYILTSEIEHIDAKVKKAHLELVLTEDEYNKYKELRPSDLARIIIRQGKIVADELDINDSGGIINIKLEDIK